MDRKRDPQEGATGPKDEELPQMDGSCDACEPDEAKPATQACHTCSFAFCPVHAERHSRSTRHVLTPYNCEQATQANGAGTSRGPRAGAGADKASAVGADPGTAPLGAPVAEGEEPGGKEEREQAQNHVPQEAEAGKNGANAKPEAAEGKPEPGKRDFVTVERLRCKEHGEEGSLYCKRDEKIICVVCAVQGEHREHEIITLREAYMWQKSREGYDLVGCTHEMGERIKNKWTSGEMTTDELEEYVNDQFEELRQLVLLEEKRTLHLVDLKEAFLTASAVEKIAEITVETEKLQEEMASITNQLCLLEQAEAQSLSPAVALEALLALPGASHKPSHDIEARPRLPEPRADPVNPRDFEDNDSGPSMDHAP
ncbi:tripartite motif-containing protein 44 [Salarias fasciatus]|uniref:B box-type domain-containing protein n=1 Tax=Salarias fasciatus TaxID=181472 RepID=A0A672FWZ1_SALFA|nr:tripartite motif-containing protein 44 [Salarias fasciatus]